MPLPAEGSPWPPPRMQPTYDAMREADVWYTGNKKEIAEFYGRAVQRDRDRPSLQDRLWAQPRDLSQPERRIHVPIAGDIATASADLLFSEAPTVRHDDATTQARLDVLAEDGAAHMRYVESAELGAALGDSYLTAVWDRDVVPDRPILTSWAGDMAIPTIRYGRLVEVTFWREVERTGDTVLRLLERHAVETGAGLIEYGIYEGTSANLGRRIPLTAHEDAAHLDPVTDDQGRQPTDIPYLTATHIPNARPNRDHRGYLGRSDYGTGVYDLFDGADQTMTSWLRDIRLGQGRAAVTAGALQDLGEGKGAFFDVHQEIYDELAMPPGSEHGITVIQFQIRHEEHRATFDHILSSIARSCGYSPSTFGLAEDGGGRTATEVVDRKSRSNTSSGRKGLYWKPSLRRISQAWIALDAVHFNGGGNPTVAPTVELAPPERQSAESIARSLQMLRSAEVISDYLSVKMQHPEWRDTEVNEEVARLEQMRTTDADPWMDASTGLAGNQLDGAPPEDDPSDE
ncbi:hypothetical protein [Nocardiopsis tropica]|uniref:Phage portal protein n=1 Tax=Nocardiopsis tropica TaxID=109330 RepID=A0ABU7KM04_9ACTN|nr:hypothetical protein [Nocardiopsis umidischolae]MEE2050319.1 hypothetical protein [Nocardiopsis umidischolae]